MRPLEQETNIEQIKSYAKAVESQLQQAYETIARLQKKLGENSQLWVNEDLRDQLSRLEQKFFGFGCETKKARPVGHTGQKLKAHSVRPHEESTSNQASPPSALDESEKVEYAMTEVELVEESDMRKVYAGAEAWEEIKGLYQESTEITVVERIYKKVVHRQAKYRLKDAYNKTGKEVIITAKGPVKLREGNAYSIDFALAVVLDKYEYHLPLERQRRKMEDESGLTIDVKTLYSQCEAVGAHVEKVLSKIRRDILSDFCAAHVDESTWRIIGAESTGYMWVLSNRLGAYYQFEPTRSGAIAGEILEGYQGAIVSDGYGGYNRFKAVDGIRRGHCWAHARREFYERWDDYPKECEEVLVLIDKLFEIEAKAVSFAELRELRKKEAREQVEKIHEALLGLQGRFLPGEGISKAVAYCLKFWPELTLFLEDLSVPISNNDAERALRHVVLGRKNFVGSKTIDGADLAATLYTVIETCKRVGLLPREYLKYLITENWYKREPLSPYEYSMKTLGPNSKADIPKKDDWRINQPGQEPS
jgi:transposase